MLKALMISKDIPMEKVESVCCLIDIGVSAGQVIRAINNENTEELDSLLVELTKGEIGKV